MEKQFVFNFYRESTVKDVKISGQTAFLSIWANLGCFVAFPHFNIRKWSSTYAFVQYQHESEQLKVVSKVNDFCLNGVPIRVIIALKNRYVQNFSNFVVNNQGVFFFLHE